jgi:hypothetical protein
MERKAKVALFEQIRREYQFGEGTVLGIARKLEVHRRMGRQALANPASPERRQWARQRPIMAPFMPLIEAILKVDRNAPRKQRHNAHRVWRGIVTEQRSGKCRK